MSGVITIDPVEMDEAAKGLNGAGLHVTAAARGLTAHVPAGTPADAAAAVRAAVRDAQADLTSAGAAYLALAVELARRAGDAKVAEQASGALGGLLNVAGMSVANHKLLAAAAKGAASSVAKDLGASGQGLGVAGIALGAAGTAVADGSNPYLSGGE